MRVIELILVLSIVGMTSSQNIQLSSYTLVAVCNTNEDCQWGYFCNNLMCQDKCALVRCTSDTICKEGQCHPICNDKLTCGEGQFCNDGYCLDRCLYMKCHSGQICQLGKCMDVVKECEEDKDCNAGLYCSYEWKCEDKCQIENYCKEGETCQNGECTQVVSTSDSVCPEKFACTKPRPDETTCPTLYWFRAPDPVVCGITSNGTLVDFPVECYACKDKTIVEYYNTTCDQVPKDCSGSSSNQTGSSSDCSNSSSDTTASVPVFTKPTLPSQIKCTNPRPNEKTCPTLTWIRQPDPVVCGVDKHGKYVDFPVQCYACKSKNISFYYNKTCAEVKKIVDALSCSKVSCDAGYECKEGKCVQTASSKQIKCTQPRPTEKDCPTINFIKKPDPLVCGVTKKGDYVDFPVECYACKSKNIVSYYNTTCDQISEAKCAAVQCKKGDKCVDGICYPAKWPVCLKNVKKSECGKKRPTQKTCPLLYFFIPPPDIVCGITSTGERISYPVECYACKNTDVIHYYNKSCQELSNPCTDKKVDKKMDKKTDVAVAGTKCAADQDCQNGFYCQEKVCVDKCIVTLCPAGTQCDKGNCIWSHLKEKPDCSTIKCRQGYKCCNGACIDMCKDVFCIATHTCVNGECVPIPL